MKNLFPCFLKISGKCSEIKENQAPMLGVVKGGLNALPLFISSFQNVFTQFFIFTEYFVA